MTAFVRSLVRIALTTVVGMSIAGVASAQGGGSPLDRIDWAKGPVKGQLGEIADIFVAPSCRFTGAEGTKMFLEMTENIPSGNELGLILCQQPSDSSMWFVVMSYNASGYVKDDEKGTLDAKKILESLRSGNEAGNEERRRRGWEELELAGWQTPPYYDTVTHNLTWGTLIRAKGGSGSSVNHSVRLLGRGGVMDVELVADPEQMPFITDVFNQMVAGFEYIPGEKYSEWREGDKIAAFGLTALVLGGGAAAAAKLGLLGKMWKAILGVLIALKKFVIVIVIAIGAFFKRMFSKKEEPAATVRAPAPPRPAAAPANALPPVVLRPRTPAGSEDPGGAGGPGSSTPPSA